MGPDVPVARRLLRYLTVVGGIWCRMFGMPAGGSFSYARNGRCYQNLEDDEWRAGSSATGPSALGRLRHVRTDSATLRNISHVIRSRMSTNKSETR
jgi:hypothetical protein